MTRGQIVLIGALLVGFALVATSVPTVSAKNDGGLPKCPGTTECGKGASDCQPDADSCTAQDTGETACMNRNQIYECPSGTIHITNCPCIGTDDCPETDQHWFCLEENLRLYSHPNFQSPVRAEPDDLVMIAGHGFESGLTVVYEALEGAAPEPPEAVPPTNGPDAGVADVVHVIPDNVVVRMPSVVESGRSYALWVRNPVFGSTWQGPLRINDARPLWISPEFIYTADSAGILGLPRELKIVGRNLQAGPGGATQVKLIGPLEQGEPYPELTLDAEDDGDRGTAIEHYVARVVLPGTMATGTYAIEVHRGDGIWIALPPIRSGETPQRLVVGEPPSPGQVHDIGQYCTPNDETDDAQCIQDVLNGALPKDSVYFGPGVWDLVTPPGGNPILVPAGVSLIGADPSVTTIIKHANWDEHAVFVLQGGTTVSEVGTEKSVYQQIREIHFHEDGTDRTVGDYFFQLGEVPPPDTVPEVVERIVFKGNSFTDMMRGIYDGRRPIRHLIVTDNDFEAIKDAIYLGFAGTNEALRFEVADSVITGNRFHPNALDPQIIPEVGIIATQIGGSRRLDFSGNEADGTLEGWRAAHFFHLLGNHEMLLISGNTMSCTGDRGGDGEGIALDTGAYQAAGFLEMLPVTAQDPGDPATFQVEGSWYRHDEEYFDRHWVQIVKGPGIGQARRIERTATDLGVIEIEVHPPFDVPPVPGQSYVTVFRQYWQTYVVDNLVDNRSEIGCVNPLDPNSNVPTAGAVTPWAVVTDSTVEGNVQKETEGIVLASVYQVEADPDPNQVPASTARLYYFDEIRGNFVDGEAVTDGNDEHSGIQARYGSSPGHESAVQGYGVAISHNTVATADNYYGSGIGVFQGWYFRQEDQWRSTLFYRNHVRGATDWEYTLGFLFGTWAVDSVLSADLVRYYGACISQVGLDTYVLHDADDDGVAACDNCPLTYNPGQTDSDGDGIGDLCEMDDCPVERSCALPGTDCHRDPFNCTTFNLGWPGCMEEGEDPYYCPAEETIHVTNCPCLGTYLCLNEMQSWFCDE